MDARTCCGIAADRRGAAGDGRRRSGLAVTAAGSLVALLEDSDAVRELWDNLPDYIHTAQEALGRFERFVQDLAEQGDRIRRVIRDQARV